ASTHGVRHLFTGQQWYSEIGLYDLRFRAYSPDTGRFLQADPIRFFGNDTNSYRYARNNPQKWTDPTGLIMGEDTSPKQPNGITNYPGVTVTGTYPGAPQLGGGAGSGAGGGAGTGGEPGLGVSATIGGRPIINYNGPNQTLPLP